MYIRSIEQASQLTDEEILDFLKRNWKSEDLRFVGEYTGDRIIRVFSGELRVKYPILKQPVFFKYTNPRLTVGKHYSFRCELASKDFRERIGNPFFLNIIHSTLREDNESAVGEISTYLRLENQFFIGQFSPGLKSGSYRITDIRNTDFTKIEDEENGIKDLSIWFSCQDRQFNKFAYYKFTWTLQKTSPLTFGIDLDKEVTPIYPKDIVESIRGGLMADKMGAAKRTTRMLDTLRKQLTQSGKEVFIYELLQNANDYPRKVKDGDNRLSLPVDVEFHITSDYLTFQHTGEYFNPKNIAAICDINDGEKSDNLEAIGYKGIGFKTVFLDNDYVYLNTGKYSFRFDKSATNVINTPWQILPVWTNPESVDTTVKNVFERHPSDLFRVKFALKPRDPHILTDRTRKDNYIDLFTNVFDTERVILFIPNIHKVSIFFGDTPTPAISRSKDNANWCVSKALVDDIPTHIRERINEALSDPDADKSDGYGKIPRKYINFYKTSVKFACERKGRELIPIEDSILYCYLPAKRAKWGFKFLMNTDMVPNGSRDDIEDIELNHEIAKISGRQFYFWVQELISCGEYDLESVFSLIPDFKDCKERHKDYESFIEEFKQEFEELIKTKPFVPVVNKDGATQYACINEIINDQTELTRANIMSDSDFMEIMELSDYYLPIQELRESPSFMSFLYSYSPGDLDIDFTDVKSKCSTEKFREWLKDSANNNRFLGHLLSQKELSKFAKEEIFIEHKGQLLSANRMYYEFDKYCPEIPFLKTFVPHLSEKTRNFFGDNKDWLEFSEGNFIEFEATKLVKSYVVNDEDAVKTIDNLANSLAFFNFIAANNVSLTGIFNKIPYFDEDLIHHYGLDGITYFYDEDAFNLSKEKWLGENNIVVLSHQYTSSDSDGKLKEVFETVGIGDFNQSSFVIEKIAGDNKFKSNINKAIDQNPVTSLSFIKYVFSEREALKEKDGQLKDYVLRCLNIEGHELYLNNDNLRYFSQPSYQGNTTFADNAKHSWLGNDMMYCLNNEYFDNFSQEDQKSLESFFRQSFGIKTFTNKSFFSDVVLGNKKTLFPVLNDKDKLTAFINYLKRDSSDIFDGSLSYNDIKDMPFLLSNGSVVSRTSSSNLYLYDESAIELENKKWLPDGLIKVLSEVYSTGFDEKTLQLLDIKSFAKKKVIEGILDNDFFKRSIADLSQNIDFWRYVKNNIKELDPLDAYLYVRFAAEGDLNADRLGYNLYISDVYQKDGIESLVRRYDETALFVSKDYLEDDTEGEKQAWVRLFKKLGLKFDNKDILFKSVIPNLKTINDDAVVAMMTKHLKDIKEEWNSIKSNIIYLQVRTRLAGYQSICNSIVVNINEDNVSEPFKNIVLSNEIAPEILNANKEIILLIANEFGYCGFLKSKQEWANAKLNEYIQTIQNDTEQRKTCHVDFIRELAVLQDNGYIFPKELISQILIKTKDETPCYLKITDPKLTLGSAYKPSCDYEANGIEAFSYVSEDYITTDNRETLSAFFRSTDIHYRFHTSDTVHLANRQFALYFWKDFFPPRANDIKAWIEHGYFNCTCIPTEDSVKDPKSLYSPELYHYAKCAPNWKENLPAKSVVDNIHDVQNREIFMLLPFRKNLSFEDCLYYLLNAKDSREDEHGRRREVINWMLSASYTPEEAVARYREQPNAKWRNGKGRFAHISELFAIHPDARQEREIFRGDEHVMQTGMFPYKVEDFERICKLLKITLLRSSDFITTPVNCADETVAMLKTLKPKLLVLAAIQNPERYQSIYEGFAETIQQYNFVVCDKIDLGYESIHNDVERIYTDDGNIYYVNSWLHRRTYSRFCKTIKRLLDIEVYDEVCEDVLEDSVTVEECIEKYCSSLLYDKTFLSYLEGLNHTISVEEEEPLAEDEGEYYSQPLSEPEEESDNEDVDVSTGANDDSTNQTSYSGTTQSGSSSSNQNQSSTGSNYERPHSQPSEDDDMDSNQDDSSNECCSDEETDNPIDNDTINVGDNTNDGSSQSHHEPRSERSSQTGYRRPSESSRPNRPFPEPKPFSKEDVERFKSRGAARTIDESSASPIEIDQLNNLLGTDMTAEEIADTNYLVRKRLYQDLNEKGYETTQNEEEFVKHKKADYQLKSGKYIQTCSASYGILYISPSVWNKLRDEKCIVCVYRGKKSNEFFYLHSTNDLLTWVNEDDILIKLTGEDKADVVNALYSSVLEGVTGTAYTMIRVASNAIYDPVFAPFKDNPDQIDSLDEL